MHSSDARKAGEDARRLATFALPLSPAVWPQEDWWASFGDPQLDTLIRDALAPASQALANGCNERIKSTAISSCEIAIHAPARNLLYVQLLSADLALTAPEEPVNYQYRPTPSTSARSH